jgi:hypothetical protein
LGQFIIIIQLLAKELLLAEELMQQARFVAVLIEVKLVHPLATLSLI